MQRTGGGHFQAVGVDGHPYRPAMNRVVAVAQSISQRFPRRRRRVEGHINPPDAIRFESSGYGEAIAQESLGVGQKRESVATKLPIVQKFHLVNAPKTGNS